MMDRMLLNSLIMLVAYVSAFAYFPMQVYTGIRWLGIWRIAALVPIWLMAPVFGLTAYAFADPLNRWTLLLIVGAPVGTGYLVILMIVRAFVIAGAARRR